MLQGQREYPCPRIGDWSQRLHFKVVSYVANQARIHDKNHSPGVWLRRAKEKIDLRLRSAMLHEGNNA